MKQTILAFTTNSYVPLWKKICQSGNFIPGEIERKFFSDGERYLRILSPVLQHDVVLIGGTVSDLDTIEIFDLASAIAKYGARTLTLVIPYFGYQTMERAVKPGEVVTAKTRARLLSAIPQARTGTRVMLLDLHAEGLPHYFEDTIHPFHVYAKSLMIDIIRDLGGRNYVLACTDAGRAKWVESLANDLGIDASFIFKRRVSDDTTEVLAVSAQVKNKKVVIYDDILRSGNSMINAAKAYMEAGALTVSAAVTHGVFTNDSLSRIKNSGLFERFACTDSHPRALQLKDDFLEVSSVAELLTDNLKSLYQSR